MFVHDRAASAAMARQLAHMRPGAAAMSTIRCGRPAGARALALGAALIGGLLLSACKTLSPDAGMETVADIAGDALKADVQAIRTPEQAAAARAKVEGLLRRPLSARAAVQVALLNNRGLQTAYNELGIAEAAMVEASLPPSPDLFGAAHCGLGRDRDRASHRRRHSGARHAAGAPGDRRRSVSPGATARRRGHVAAAAETRPGLLPRRRGARDSQAS